MVVMIFYGLIGNLSQMALFLLVVLAPIFKEVASKAMLAPVPQKNNQSHIDSSLLVEKSIPLVRQEFSFIFDDICENISLDSLAQQQGLSRYQFSRLFYRKIGIPPMQWLWCYRLFVASELMLSDPNRTLTDIALSCGFATNSHFTKKFKFVYGQAPSLYRVSRITTRI